jgi:aminoglycoside phosphotransferase (APT) family kinase protein
MKTGPMHPGMHPIDDNFVRRLIAGQFPQWAGLALRRWPSDGTVNAMYRLGDDMVARLPLVEGGAKDVSMEQEWLHRRAPHLPTRIPEVLGAGQPAEGYPWPWSLHRWLAGDHPEVGALSEPVRLAEDLAEFVAAMRSIPRDGAQRPARDPGGARRRLKHPAPICSRFACGYPRASTVSPRRASAAVPAPDNLARPVRAAMSPARSTPSRSRSPSISG